MAAEPRATSPEAIHIRDGFAVELLHSAEPEDGSWISICFDDRGRLIAARDDAGIMRVTLPTGDSPLSREYLKNTEPLKHCRGVLYAHNSLYVSATNSNGLYRLRDLDGDDQFEEVRLVSPMDYRSRYGHGTNQIVSGPDGMIYWVIGNDVSFPESTDPNSPYRNPHNDWALPSPHDQGHDDRVGYILKTDPDCTTWSIVAGGLRNQVDLAFHPDGEMFTWDADMEWDAGLPWYRPTRINHIVSGGEYGWRWGTGKWAEWYPDSLPSNLDTGYGSPTGVEFGTRSRWPQRYRNALFAADWQNGRMLMIDLVPQGATYFGTSELFLEGAPLNICDFTFGPDGQMYFITGGRGSQTGLYRVTATPAADVPATSIDPMIVNRASEARSTRHALEKWHARQDPTSLPFILKHLADDDPWIRFAARIALENQPVETWKGQIQEHPAHRGRLTAGLALARVGRKDDQKPLWDSAAKANWMEATPEELLWRARTLQVSIARHGLPEGEPSAKLMSQLEQVYPQPSYPVNRLLAELLAVARSSEFTAKTATLLQKATTQEEQIQYAKTLVNARLPWTPDQRRIFLQWLYVSRRLPGGKLVDTTMINLRNDFLSSLSELEKRELQTEIARLDEPLPEEFPSPLANRPIVREWTVDALLSELGETLPEDSSEQGWGALAAATCLRCHQVGDRGGRIGPDLSTVGKRYDVRALLESIVEPSKVVDPKYLYSTYILTDGRVVTGRPVGVGRSDMTLETNPLTGATEKILRAEIEESRISPLSPMPAGLLNTFTRDEIAALIAVLRRRTGEIGRAHV